MDAEERNVLAADERRWTPIRTTGFRAPRENGIVPSKRKPSKVPKKRNITAALAKNQKAVVMKDRREPRGGARNETRDALREGERGRALP